MPSLSLCKKKEMSALMIFQENWETSFQINELCTLQDYAIA